MKYNARKFNQKSYNQYDSKAKQLITKWLINKNYQIIQEKETYQHDIIAELNNKKTFFEVEIKIGYPFTNKESFKFNTVSFLGRKEKLHLLHPFIYIIICEETNWALAANSNIIYQNKYKENISVNTKNRKGNDQMFRIPKELCSFFKIN